MAYPSPPPVSTATTTADDRRATATISDIHSDVLETHILTRLNGRTLASAACTSTQLHTLASQESLWTNICHSTWPSTALPRVRDIISTFPNGSRSFFSDSFPPADTAISGNQSSNHDNSSELISAVDIYYKNKLIFSKVVETETVSGWFICSPFRIDLLDPKDTVATQMPHPNTDDTCQYLEDDLTLSWIIIDPIERRAMDLSSHRPVSVQRHWLSGEVQVWFTTVLTGEKGSASEFVQCGIVVTCGRSTEGEMRVIEVSLQVEDMDGMHLNGRDSLVILERTLEGKRGKTGRREAEGKRKFLEFQERKTERKERRLRTEGALDMMCVAFGILGFTSLGLYIFCI
ncbi:hypothetical protein SLEP1_g46746 [Rubroshorea leprosula]|uniref:F-box domain-containing protein n=1 Tax=Rubroshorea leprosula TaxID=152421 RepID=A0AAV5LPW6_9ROSI|nr:hypothetical protein SLEP1_g46746 [Rubroshorea leprosula]